jgi:RNA polymerase subunit RPABC4/transcription elongation factor Spt4
MSKGIKVCSNCGHEVGARTHFCPECSLNFATGKVAPAQAAKAMAVAAPKTYKTLGKGRKACGACGTIVGARVLACPCGEKFSDWEWV